MHKSANINVNVELKLLQILTEYFTRVCVDFKMKIAVYSAKIEIFARSHEANVFFNEIIQLLHSENLW